MKNLCKLFGHSYSQKDLLIAEIKSNPLNIGRGDNILKCRRCGNKLDLNNYEEIERYVENEWLNRNFFKTLYLIFKDKLCLK